MSSTTFHRQLRVHPLVPHALRFFRVTISTEHTAGGTLHSRAAHATVIKKQNAAYSTRPIICRVHMSLTGALALKVAVPCAMTLIALALPAPCRAEVAFGEEDVDGVPPFVARLLVEMNEDRGTGACVAAFVNPRVAVTAAHCVRGAADVRLVGEAGERVAHVLAVGASDDVCTLTVDRDWPTTAPLSTATPKSAFTVSFEREFSPRLVVLRRVETCDGVCYHRVVPSANESCRGDSGAPLLVTTGGDFAVAAVLSRGAPFCARADAHPLVFESDWNVASTATDISLALALASSCAWGIISGSGGARSS